MKHAYNLQNQVDILDIYMTINTSRYDFYKIQRNNKISVI